VSLETDFFGMKLINPFILSASPMTYVFCFSKGLEWGGREEGERRREEGKRRERRERGERKEGERRETGGREKGERRERGGRERRERGGRERRERGEREEREEGERRERGDRREIFLIFARDGYEQMKLAYEHGWAGGIMKTAFDGVHVHIPNQYMTKVIFFLYRSLSNLPLPSTSPLPPSSFHPPPSLPSTLLPLSSARNWEIQNIGIIYS
jgi:hypothetical protein